MPQQGQWLHLFTSNIRELYIADAIDLLAVPEGYLFQFRYAESHVQDGVRETWKDGRLQGANVIVYFSLQHAANFHPAAYVPLRYGHVVDTFVEGKTYVVRFRVAGYAALPKPDGADEADHYVLNFSDELRELLAPSYPDYPQDKSLRRSATMGPAPKGLPTAHNEGVAFERVVEYVAKAIEPQHRMFYRVAHVWKNNREDFLTIADDGYLELTAGNQYTVEIAHFQLSSRESAVIQVKAPDAIKLLTPPELPLRSRYDVMPIRLFAPFTDVEAQGEFTLGIKAPELGGNVRIPVRIKPSKVHSIGFPVAAILGTLLAVLAATLGDHASLSQKLWLTIGGAALVALSAWVRRSRGLPT